MMRGNRGYIRGGRGASSYRGQSTSTYRGNSSGGNSTYNNNSYVNRDNSAGGGSGAGIGGRYSGGGGMMNDNRGRGGFDHSFNSNSSRYAPPVSSNPRYLGNNPLPDGGYNKRPYPSSHSSRDRSPDRKRNRPETSRRNDDYGQNNSSYNSGGGGGGNTYNNRYDGNNSGGGGFQPTRRYETTSRGGGGSSSQAPNNHRSTAYRPSSIDDHVSRPVRNHDRYEQQQHHHHHNNNTNNSHHSSSGQYSPPVRRPYVGRGGPSNRIISTYRGRGTTYGRGTGIRRPYGTTLHARSSIGGYGAPPSSGSGGGHSSYVRRTTTAADAIRRKMLMPKVSTATDMARKLKIAKLRSTIRKNNEKKGVTATDGDSDTETPSKGATNMELDEDEELKCDPDDDEMDQEDDATADTGVESAEKQAVAPKKLTSIKVEARSAKVKRSAANDEEVDEDELQIDNDVDDDIDNEGGDNDDDDDQPEYAVQKRMQNRTYIKLDCAHCRRSYFTIKSYNFHLYGSQHKNALFQTAQRQKAQVARIRVLQRRAQRELEDAQADLDDDDEDESAIPLLGAPQFCMLCRLNYRSDVTEHQQSKEHRQIKRILKPSCRTCQVGFTCPMDYEMHRASLDHLKMEAEAEEMQDSVDVNWGEFQTVDSIGDVDDAELLLKNADDEAAAADAHDEDEDTAGAAATERRKRNGKTATTVAVKVRSPAKEPVNIGVEMIREIQVMYCDVCRTTLTQRTDPELTLRNHCRWRTHIKLYNQHIEAEARRDARKRKQQQLEKAAAEKRKRIDTANGGGGNAKSSVGGERSTAAAVVAGGGDAAADVANAVDDANVSGHSAAAADSVNVSANNADAAGEVEESAVVDDAAGNKVDEDDDDVVDDKMWADVDKDLGELLQAVNSENANDDEDEDSTANTERYDRFKNSEQDKPTDGSAGPSGSGQSKPTAVEASKKTTPEIGVVTSSADKTNTVMHAPN